MSMTDIAEAPTTVAVQTLVTVQPRDEHPIHYGGKGVDVSTTAYGEVVVTNVSEEIARYDLATLDLFMIERTQL